ncbi:glycoside hydrolase family 16 protein [Ralstonia sp. ASV6]|uniref:glycoside hydrolase family 16 protein n=1 Tax=Ralstonia sp. ASV6 TaxID=2795124 RepID=UPI0018EB0C8F|nr:glycoside hydrolase family 16 protein [Ralstonia sp. ASV6]
MLRHPFHLLCLLVSIAGTCTVAMAREVEFSGQRWVVRSSGGQLSGPGPNVFSDGLDAVRVDAQGRLRMAIAKTPQGWHSAEVTLSRPLGYGTYELDVETNPFGMDRQAVFGFFSYSSAPEQAHRELDVELSYWGRPGEANNAQFVVQPSGAPDTLRRFQVNHGPVTYRIRWERGLAEFSATTADGAVLQHWSRTVGVPEAGDARIQLNLWLFQGKPPQNGQPVEFVVRGFRFSPSGAAGAGPVPVSGPQR